MRLPHSGFVQVRFAETRLETGIPRVLESGFGTEEKQSLPKPRGRDLLLFPC
jgi:hypothetical protein